MTLQLTDENFEQEVVGPETGVVFVDFWAPWCGPCKMIGPVIEEIAKEYDSKARIAKLNVDENQKTAAKYDIMSIPTMLIFKDGKEVDKLIGAVPKGVITEKLDKWIG